MALADAVSVQLGADLTDRQPAAGVEEKITAVVKNGSTDEMQLRSGSTNISFSTAAINGVTETTTMRNMALMITNTTFLRKSGTTDIGVFMGVQTNA